MKNTKKILIIEDNKQLAKALGVFLNGEGYETIAKNIGSEGVKYAQENDVDCIILDILMPVKSGTKILEEIKADEKIKDIPVIVTTNMESSEITAKAMELGVKHYLIKADNSLNQVKETLENVLQ